MSNAKLKLMVSVFTRRMASGESFEDILADYPKLTENDINQIREALGID
ncbi:MAG: DUF433 domain-containing protein [Eubacterium sp.]|nr:DUF433 domain-containing protein [Eubacterium sp.]MBR2247346.1 DUF433 domain-containing protein [Bacilli bacterium]